MTGDARLPFEIKQAKEHLLPDGSLVAEDGLMSKEL
jgi:hypothetical protein